MIIVTGAVRARPESFDEVLRIATEHVIRSRAEPGCISHAVYRDTEEPMRLQFVERWTDMAALKVHFAVPASGEAVRAMAALCDEAPAMTLYDDRAPNAVIRAARSEDAAAIAAIYAHHVAHGTASFDYEAPDGAFWAEKIADLTAKGWPFAVAEIDGEVAGYAYATQLRDRPGYRYTCEDSIYVHPDCIGRGVGKALLGHLIELAKDRGFRQMIAVIGGGEPASVGVHAGTGFREVGRLNQVGFKHGRVLDTVYMQRAL